MRGFWTTAMILFVIIFVFLMLMPILFAELFPIVKLLMLGYFCLIIFTFVRGIMGAGALTYLISGILIYIFVWKLWPLFAAGYMLFLIMAFGLSGIIVFGLPRGKIGRKARAAVG